MRRNAGTLRLNANADSLVSPLVLTRIKDRSDNTLFSRLQLPERDGFRTFVQRLRDLDLRHTSRRPGRRPHIHRRARQLRTHLFRHLCT